MSDEVKATRTTRGGVALKAGPRLSIVRSQLAELRHEFRGRIQELEDGAHLQKQELAGVMGELPVQIDGLIAGCHPPAPPVEPAAVEAAPAVKARKKRSGGSRKKSKKAEVVAEPAQAPAEAEGLTHTASE